MQALVCALIMYDKEESELELPGAVNGRSADFLGLVELASLGHRYA